MNRIAILSPGILTALLIALAAKFLSLHYSMPSMLMALLLGLSMNSLFHETPAQAGVIFASKDLLRVAVGLLGIRVSYDLIVDIGIEYLLLSAGSTALVIGFGILCSRLAGRGTALGLITGGATAICGASAAVAIAAVLPQSPENEKRLTATVFAVTALSTLAMIGYPLLTDILGYRDSTAGAFLGATIHDVAQVVGAGLSISDQAGNSAILVKLFRVSMLAPVVLLVSLWATRQQRDACGQTAPLLPGFVILFLILATLNSLGWVPNWLVQILSEASSWGLLVAIAAVGMKTSFRGFWSSGSTVFYLVLAQTLFLVLIFVGAINLLDMA